MLKRQYFDNPLPTAAYIRRSKESEDSIENQLKMVKDVIDLDPELSYVDAYIDNGYSGRNFERPAWKRLIDDCKAGRIKCIVVRDLSRLGRNYIDTGTYLEDIFPDMGVRVQSIVENYDSETDEAIKIAPENLINQYFAEDTSEKVRLQIQLSMLKGDPAGNIHYGYKKENKMMLPDPEEAEVVKKIFSLAAKGERVADIAAILQEEKIQTPSGPQGNHKWSERTVRRMLQDRIYLGEYERHTKERNLREVTEVAEEEQFHFDNHHPAIVTEAEFEIVQQNLAKYSRKKKSVSDIEPDDLQGLVFCSSCGKQASFIRSNPQTGVATAKYYCRNHTGAKATGERFEKRPEIQAEQLKTQLVSECNAYITRLLELEPRMTATKAIHPNLAFAYRDKVKALEKQKEENSNLLFQYYMDYVQKKRTKEDYIQKQQEIRDQFPNIEGELTNVRTELSLHNHAVIELEAFIPKYVPAPMSEFDAETVRKIVDEIELNPDGSIGISFKRIRYVEMVEKLINSIT